MKQHRQGRLSIKRSLVQPRYVIRPLWIYRVLCSAHVQCSTAEQPHGPLAESGIQLSPAQHRSRLAPWAWNPCPAQGGPEPLNHPAWQSRKLSSPEPRLYVRRFLLTTSHTPQPTMQLTTLACGLLALLASQVSATALTYKLVANEKACFYANNQDKGQKIAFYFAVCPARQTLPDLVSGVLTIGIGTIRWLF